LVSQLHVTIETDIENLDTLTRNVCFVSELRIN